MSPAALAAKQYAAKMLTEAGPAPLHLQKFITEALASAFESGAMWHGSQVLAASVNLTEDAE